MSAGWAVMLCLLPGAAALQEQAATALAPVVEGAEAAACRIRFTGRMPTDRFVLHHGIPRRVTARRGACAARGGASRRLAARGGALRRLAAPRGACGASALHSAFHR